MTRRAGPTLSARTALPLRSRRPARLAWPAPRAPATQTAPPVARPARAEMVDQAASAQASGRLGQVAAEYQRVARVEADLRLRRRRLGGRAAGLDCAVHRVEKGDVRRRRVRRRRHDGGGVASQGERHRLAREHHDAASLRLLQEVGIGIVVVRVREAGAPLPNRVADGVAAEERARERRGEAALSRRARKLLEGARAAEALHGADGAGMTERKATAPLRPNLSETSLETRKETRCASITEV
eukprot:CAMPEP_0185320140 /NCGR_PEP_ID=MMETSP1363-20130426/53922_1 /TAXON_ID=38817 /ORGANISM="Gephyrocapsa oceanica, Strain RCC1303" /LENGTH=241 /DNA_ID=CAMNT_0027918543 /DNA_START=70 /DNA_END=794 /DNA_ORIENTATION=-